MKRTFVYLAIGVILATMSLSVEAQVLRRGFGGALGGAALGSLIDGEDGAKKGAIIGGSVGVIRGVSEKSRRRAEQEARQRQEAERQRLTQEQQQAEIEQLKAQQAAQAAETASPAPASAVSDATLVIEIQKSLIRIGFDPGDVNGKAGPKTIEAIKQYQAKQGLLKDGRPSQELLVHMLKHGG